MSDDQPTDAEIVEAVKEFGRARKAVLENLRSRYDLFDGSHWGCFAEKTSNDYDPCVLCRAEADAEHRVRMLAERTAGVTYPKLSIPSFEVEEPTPIFDEPPRRMEVVGGIGGLGHHFIDVTDDGVATIDDDEKT